MATDFNALKNNVNRILQSPTPEKIREIEIELYKFTNDPTVAGSKDCEEAQILISQVRSMKVEIATLLEDLNAAGDDSDLRDDALEKVALFLDKVEKLPADLVPPLLNMRDNVNRLLATQPTLSSKLPEDLLKPPTSTSQNNSVSRNLPPLPDEQLPGVVDSNPSVRTKLEIANDLRYKGRWDEAAHLYEEVLKVDPHNEDANYGFNATKNNQAKLGVDFERLPEEVKYYFQRAQSFERTEDMDEAKAYYEKAAEEAKKHKIINWDEINKKLISIEEVIRAENLYKEALRLRDLDNWDQSIVLLERLNRTTPREIYKKDLADLQHLRSFYSTALNSFQQLDRKRTRALTRGSTSTFKVEVLEQLEELLESVQKEKMALTNSKKLNDLEKQISSAIDSIHETMKETDRLQNSQKMATARNFIKKANDATTLDQRISFLQNANDILTELCERDEENGDAHEELAQVSLRLQEVDRTIDIVDELKKNRFGSQRVDDTEYAFSQMNSIHDEMANIREWKDLETKLISDIWRHFRYAKGRQDFDTAQKMIMMLDSDMLSKVVPAEQRDDERDTLKRLRLRANYGSAFKGSMPVVITGLVILILAVGAWAVYRFVLNPTNPKPTQVPPSGESTLSANSQPNTTPLVITATQGPTVAPTPTDTPFPYTYGKARVQDWTYKSPLSPKSLAEKNNNYVVVGNCVRVLSEKRDNKNNLWIYIEFADGWSNGGWVPKEEIDQVSETPCTP